MSVWEQATNRSLETRVYRVSDTGGGSPKATTQRPYTTMICIEAALTGSTFPTLSQSFPLVGTEWAAGVPIYGVPQASSAGASDKSLPARSSLICLYHMLQQLWRPGSETARETLPKATSLSQIYRPRSL